MNSSSPWILFDAVGTIIRPREPIAETYRRVAASFGSRLDAATIGRRFREQFTLRESAGTSTGDSSDRWRTSDGLERAWWRSLVDAVLDDVNDADACFETLWNEFARPERWSYFDDVAAVTTALQSQGWKLGVASNFDSRLSDVLRGLTPPIAWDAVWTAVELGHRKPAAAFYRVVIERCLVVPRRIVMIGDRDEHDVEPALAAGLHAVRIDRAGTLAAVGSNSSPVLRSLADLPACVESITTARRLP